MGYIGLMYGAWVPHDPIRDMTNHLFIYIATELKRSFKSHDLRSFSMLGITVLPLFMKDARKPSTDSKMTGGRTKLHKQKY